jgi:alanine or glycine:cation symporter, AGCS family
MEWIDGLFSTLSMYLWGWPMIILLLGTHIYLTVLLKFPQRKIFKAIRLSVKKDPESDGDVSQFSSLATSLAATVGTGNIIGVATAVALGGPGAVLWCWLTGVFGIATKYSEGLLAIKYRVRTSNGQMLGGPMYALERGLGMKWLAMVFCVFAAVASLGIGNTVQSNAISTLLFESYNIPVVVSGSVMTLLVALILVFGLKGIARVCSMFVPFMAVFYVLGCIVILMINREFLGETFRLIFSSAFTPRAAGGGFVGATVLMAARYGIARGLFSNESGMGSAPIVAAAAKTRNPVRQALVSSTGTFWDTVVICALTGLVLVSSILAFPDIDSAQGAALTKAAFGKIPIVGHLILTFGIVSFAFSTILGWYYYGERSVEYLFGKKPLKVFKAIWIIGVFTGAVAELSTLWNMADCMNALMAIPNLISLLLLSGVIVNETRKYIKKGDIDKFSDDDIPQI